MNYSIFIKREPKLIIVQATSMAAPAGYVQIGTFIHDGDINELNDGLESSVNHVLWHHVREALYHRSDANPAVEAKWPNNITDVNNYKITLNTPPVAVQSVELGANFTLGAGNTRQLNPVFTPANAANKTVNYTSSTPATATVNGAGLVTAVAAGTTIVTVTTVDGGKTDTVTVTVP